MRIETAGGWYCDALPTGEFVRLIRHSHLETQRGRVELPRMHGSGAPQNLLYVDLAPDGVRCAGVGNEDDLVWEWTGTAWDSHGTAVGPRAVIYDLAGVLRIVHATGGPTGSQGWRYVDSDTGRLVPSDATYADPVHRVWEYTERGALVIGQGGKGIYGEDPVIALVEGRRILVAEGQCRFIKFRRDGDQISLAWVQEDRGSCVQRWLTLDALRALPDAEDTAPPTPPIPPPPEPPQPPEEPDPMYQPIPMWALIVAEVWDRATPEQRRQHGWVANAVAWELNLIHADGRRWFVNLKRGGPDTSEDAISTPHNLGAGGWAIIDIVGNFGRDDAAPGWLDQTQATIDKGEIGGGLAPTDPWASTQVPDPTVPALRARIAVLEAEIRDAAATIAELRARPMPDADYPSLIATLKAAAIARGHFHGLAPAQLDDVMEETAHLCHRVIFRHANPIGTPAEGVIEEARRRGAGIWRDDW